MALVAVDLHYLLLVAVVVECLLDRPVGDKMVFQLLIN